jgi:hypothetical protein
MAWTRRCSPRLWPATWSVGQLDADAPERLAFYQLEHCLEVLAWAWQADRPWFVQAQRLIAQVLDGVRMRLPG